MRTFLADRRSSRFWCRSFHIPHQLDNFRQYSLLASSSYFYICHHKYIKKNDWFTICCSFKSGMNSHISVNICVLVQVSPQALDIHCWYFKFRLFTFTCSKKLPHLTPVISSIRVELLFHSANCTISKLNNYMKPIVKVIPLRSPPCDEWMRKWSIFWEPWSFMH